MIFQPFLAIITVVLTKNSLLRSTSPNRHQIADRGNNNMGSEQDSNLTGGK